MLAILRDWNHTVRLISLSDDVNRKFEYILETMVLKRLAHTLLRLRGRFANFHIV